MTNNNSKTEIDFIIEKGLEKIVNDKINEKINSIDFQFIAEQLIRKTFIKSIKEDIEKNISNYITQENIINRLNIEDDYGDNKLISAIEDGVIEGLGQYISKQMNTIGYIPYSIGEDIYETLDQEKKDNILISIKNIFLKLFK